MFRALVVALACLAACGEAKGPLVTVRTGDLPAGTTALDLSGTPLYRLSWSFKLEVVSRATHSLNLQARLEQPAPAGMEISLVGPTSILPKGSGDPSLVIKPPKTIGPFQGRITLYCDELEDWSHTWTFSGDVVDKPIDGKHIRLRPAGVDFGDVRPGEKKPFVVSVRNGGTENIVVREWRVDNVVVQLERLEGGEIIVPGAELQVSGTITVPKSAGRFMERIRVLSDADNAKVRDIVLSGNVVADYALDPPRLQWLTVYRASGREARIVVKRAAEAAPFIVDGVLDAAPYFEVVSTGGKTPADAQTVTLKLLKKAPLGPARIQLRVRIGPSSIEIEWPVEINVVASIHAQPSRLNFGRLGPGKKAIREIRLSSFARRTFKVTAVRSEKGFFVATAKTIQGMPPSVVVQPAQGLRPGAHRDRIVIETDDEETPKLFVPVYAEIR